MIGQLGLGGTEEQVALLAQGVDIRGIEVLLVAMFGDGPREAELRTVSVPVFHLGFREFMSLRCTPANDAAFARLVHLLRRQRQEAQHSLLVLSYPLAALVARTARVPVLAAGRRSLGDFKQHRPLPLGVERLATRGTDLLIAHAVPEDMLRREHAPARKIAVIHNEPPDEAFAPRPPARIDTGRPVLLCIANLKLRKGHRRLLKASNAVMEVTAAGRSIVTSTVGGTPEWLRGRGVPIPPVDPEALGSAVRGLLAEPIREAGLVTAARQRSHAHLSAAAMAEEHIRIYNELLGRRCAA